MKIPVVVLLAAWASVGLAADGGTYQELVAIYLAGKDHGPIENLERPGKENRGQSRVYAPIPFVSGIEVAGSRESGDRVRENRGQSRVYELLRNSTLPPRFSSHMK